MNRPRYYRLFVLVLALLSVFIAGCGGDGSSSNPVTATDYVGNWTGTWTNQTFGSTGAATMNITVDQTAKTVTTVLDMQGPVFGSTFGAPETYTGTYTDTGFTLNTTSAVFGTVALTVDSNGNITGSGTNVPNANISRVDFTGTSNGQRFDLTYTVRFVNSSTAVGVLNLTKQ
jgi:hypothetical protein